MTPENKITVIKDGEVIYKGPLKSPPNKAAAALSDPEFRPRREIDQTKIIPRKRKHSDVSSSD